MYKSRLMAFFDSNPGRVLMEGIHQGRLRAQLGLGDFTYRVPHATGLAKARALSPYVLNQVLPTRLLRTCSAFFYSIEEFHVVHVLLQPFLCYISYSSLIGET